MFKSLKIGNSFSNPSFLCKFRGKNGGRGKERVCVCLLGGFCICDLSSCHWRLEKKENSTFDRWFYILSFIFLTPFVINNRRRLVIL